MIPLPIREWARTLQEATPMTSLVHSHFTEVPTGSRAKVVRVVLAFILGLAALNALGGAFYGLTGAPDIPRAWLAGTPFHDYFVPSFVLLAVVGGSLSFAAVAVAAKAQSARGAAFLAGIVLLAWIAVQVAMIGYVSLLQPISAATAFLVTAMSTGLPHARQSVRPAVRAFARYYAGTARHAQRTFDELLLDRRRLQFGGLALLSNAAFYTLVYVFLVMGGGRPTVFAPWLAIEPELYYRYELFMLAPSMVMSWLLAAAIVQIAGRALGGKGTFEDTLALLGFATAIASWWTLAHDLFTSGLGAFGVINQRAYEDAMSSATPFRTLLWMLMAGYLVTFVVLFAKAVASAHGLRRGPAALVGTLGFVTYQGIFVIFNR